MKDKLDSVIDSSGIWGGNQIVTHKFLLSEDVFSIDVSQYQKLERLGYALYDCLLGLSHIASIVYNKQLNYQGDWKVIRDVFSSGVPSMYHDLYSININQIPKLLKVDFMLDRENNLKIAEIDGHNKHGLGYSTLAMNFKEILEKNSLLMPGVVKTLAEEIKRLGFSTIHIFYADQEKFYVPEFMIAKREFEKYDISCLVVSEMEADFSLFEDGLFLDLPFLYHRIDLYKNMFEAYKNKKINFIIPPKPFFGAKGVLALLRNDSKNKQLECILSSFIKEESLELVRSHIPETYLLGKDCNMNIIKLLDFRKFVLKESISSGMKGVFFHDDPMFDSMFKRACGSKMNWVLQEEVLNQPQKFSFYDSDNNLQEANDWFMRVTIHYVNRKIGDGIVTARRDKSVHGAKDCLQIGVNVS